MENTKRKKAVQRRLDDGFEQKEEDSKEESKTKRDPEVQVLQESDFERYLMRCLQETQKDPTESNKLETTDNGRCRQSETEKIQSGGHRGLDAWKETRPWKIQPGPAICFMCARGNPELRWYKLCDKHMEMIKPVSTVDQK